MEKFPGPAPQFNWLSVHMAAADSPALCTHAHELAMSAVSAVSAALGQDLSSPRFSTSEASSAFQMGGELMELPKMAGTLEVHSPHAQIQLQKQFSIMGVIGVFVYLSVHFNDSALAVTAAVLAFGYFVMESWNENKRELHLISTKKESMAQMVAAQERMQKVQINGQIEMSKLQLENDRNKREAEEKRYQRQLEREICKIEAETERCRIENSSAQNDSCHLQ